MNDTKEAILAAALALFSKNGYEAVSMRDISGALNMTAGALYKHYAGKQAIFDSILARMEENDRLRARQFGLPEEEYGAAPDAYERAGLSELAAFAEAQFRYWTEDGFARAFRRLLTIEQYREPRLQALYRNYLSTGPLEYTADLFRGMPGCDPDALALEFYAPLYFLISRCDGEDGARPLEAARAHIAAFLQKYQTNQRR